MLTFSWNKEREHAIVFSQKFPSAKTSSSLFLVGPILKRNPVVVKQKKKWKSNWHLEKVLKEKC